MSDNSERFFLFLAFYRSLCCLFVYVVAVVLVFMTFSLNYFYC